MKTGWEKQQPWGMRIKHSTLANHLLCVHAFILSLILLLLHLPFTRCKCIVSYCTVQSVTGWTVLHTLTAVYRAWSEVKWKWQLGKSIKYPIVVLRTAETFTRHGQVIWNVRTRHLRFAYEAGLKSYWTAKVCIIFYTFFFFFCREEIQNVINVISRDRILKHNNIIIDKKNHIIVWKKQTKAYLFL
jgi:hypothetical protein